MLKVIYNIATMISHFVLALLVILGLHLRSSSASLCEVKEIVKDPKAITDDQFGELYTLNRPKQSNVSSCSWHFSSSPSFVINIMFINFTFSKQPSTLTCNDEYIIIKQKNSNSSISSWSPFCGQRILPDLRVNSSIEIQLHFNERKSSNESQLSVTIYVEASSKECGGVFEDDAYGIPLQYHANDFLPYQKFGIVHCVWFFNFNSMMTANVIPTSFGLKKSYRQDNKCRYYLEFLSIRKWNSLTRKFEKDIEECGDISQLPRLFKSENSNRFAITIHSEYNRRSNQQMEAIYFPTSVGHSMAITVEGIGMQSYRNTDSNVTENAWKIGLLLMKVKRKEDNFYLLTHDIDGGCEGAKIELWEGVSNQLQYNKTIFDKRRTTQDVITFGENAVLIYFNISLFQQSTGFNVSYFSTTKGCGGLYQLASGQNQTINSPKKGNSGKYPDNLDCRWGIVTSHSNKLNITTLAVSLEAHSCKYDYIQLFFGFLLNSQTFQKICKLLKNDIVGNGDVLFYFHSDYSHASDGFLIQIIANAENTTQVTRKPNTYSCTSSSTLSPTTFVIKSQNSTSFSTGYTRSWKASTIHTNSSISTNAKPTDIVSTQTDKTTNKFDKNKYKKSKGESSKTEPYLIGIISGVAVVLCLVLVAIIFILRRRFSCLKDDSENDAAKSKKTRTRQNSAMPLVRMDELRKPSLPENMLASTPEDETAEKSISHNSAVYEGIAEGRLSIKEIENPYYASFCSSLELDQQDKEVTNPYYITSDENVYENAKVIENVYAEPGVPKRNQEYNYAEIGPSSTNDVHSRESNEENHVLENDYIL